MGELSVDADKLVQGNLLLELELLALGHAQ